MQEASPAQVFEFDVSRKWFRIRCGRSFQHRLCNRVLCGVLVYVEAGVPFPGVVRLTYPGDGRRPPQSGLIFEETHGDDRGATRIKVTCKCGAGWVIKADAVAGGYVERHRDHEEGVWTDLTTRDLGL